MGVGSHQTEERRYTYTGTTNIQVIQHRYRVPPMKGQINEGEPAFRVTNLTRYQAHPGTEAPVPQAAHSGCYPLPSYLSLCSSCLDASPHSTSDDRQQHSALGGIHQRSRGHATLPLWVAPIAASLPAWPTRPNQGTWMSITSAESMLR